MSEYQILTVLAAFVLLYSLVASRLERTPFSGALVYLLVGLVCGPVGLRWIDLQVDAKAMSWLAELTLALVLFTDAANARLQVLRRFEAIPVRLLLIGLPLTIVLGFGVGAALLPDLGWFELALLATMLAPTDAALGKAVVTNKAVPESVRESLNVESGLNDGICVPVLLLFLTLSDESLVGRDALALVISLPLQAIGIGALVGIVLGMAGSAAIHQCVGRRWIEGTWLQIPVAALALLCFASAQWSGGSGFIASFVGGMTFGALARENKVAPLKAAEGTGDVMAMLTWFAFGTLLFTRPFGTLDWRIVTYAVASLTVIRMLPVFLSVAGLRLRTDTKLFLGWFGPRGLASIVFAVLVLEAQLPHGDTLLATTACTILLSIIAHGLTANYLATRYGATVGEGEI